jgi:hypothetical protein
MTADSRREVRFFVSYAQNNLSLALKFKQKFEDQLRPSRAYSFSLWQDVEILPGQYWKKEINDSLTACDLGLLLITPSFLSSSFIKAVELPAFVGVDAPKPFIPVLLSDINIKRHDLAGLDNNQIYAYKSNGGARKSFGKCNGSQRDSFVEVLHELIESRLDKLYKK